MSSKWMLWFSALCVLVLSGMPRVILMDARPDKVGVWNVSDPDSLYHARRVERALLEEGLPAATDPFLNFPEGAAVPWPPYYDQLAAWMLGPFVRDGDEIDRGALERGVARLPLLFGLLTSLFAFAAARQLAGNTAGFLAGGLHALAMGSIVYSRLGNGDHHAFHAMLSGAILWGMSFALQGKRLGSKRQALGLGVGLGALVGLAMGSWVAALLLMLVIDVLFAVLLVLQASRPRAGLALFGLSLHTTALLVLLPAVLQSPWKQEFPWMVVNLSWFHPVFLGLGALVFVPHFFLASRPRVLRVYPLLVGASLLLLALLSLALDGGPVAGIREGFEWVTRQDSFMANIDESRPLFGEGAVPGGVSTYVGRFFWLIPIAWALGLWRIVKGACLQLLPWIVAVPPLLFQAVGQVRFTDTLIGPAAVLVAWLLATEIPWSRWRKARGFLIPAALAFLFLSQSTTCLRVWRFNQGAQEDRRPKRARRELCEWIAEERPSANAAVLAPWALGHEIEWIAQRPSVATNFGSYVGLDGYLSPARFFLSLDPVRAEAVLEERQADLVLLGPDLSSSLPGWIQAGPAEWAGHYYQLDAQGAGQLRRPWFESVGGQLLNDGFPRAMKGAERGDSLDFLRLVHVSPFQLGNSPISSWKGSAPSGWIWERVKGAQVRFDGEPGTTVAVLIELLYESRPNQVDQEHAFLRRGTIGADGSVRLRVPYSTVTANGDGRAHRSEWRMGDATGSLHVSEHAVLEGREVLVRP